MQQPEEEFDLPLTNLIDATILMHRDVHFGGIFDFMIDYYQKEGKGTNPEFTLARIRELAEMEKRMGHNLAAMMLGGADAEKIARAKQMYQSLRDLYETSGPLTKYPRLIADLILSEDELAENEIAAIVKEKSAIVPSLIELLRTEDLYDSLFPGYGMAPALAVQCLGKIGDKRAIISLFESIGESDLFNEEIALEALRHIGAPAKEFLLRVLQGRPLNVDNERAAIALVQFKQDSEVSAACFKMLQDPEVRKDLSLSTYLVLACEGLVDPVFQKEFLNLADASSTAPSLRADMKEIAKAW